MATTLNITDNFSTFVTKFNSLSTDAGDATALNTTATDLVSAINEIYALVDTDLDFRSKISVTDNGGDGSLSYEESTGVITYTGPSASEVRAHFSAGEGIDIASGVISAEDATTTNKGIASFNTNDFTVASGAVSIASIGTTQIDNLAIIEGKLANDAVSRAKLKDEVALVIYDSAGTALKTIYGAGS